MLNAVFGWLSFLLLPVFFLLMAAALFTTALCGLLGQLAFYFYGAGCRSGKELTWAAEDTAFVFDRVCKELTELGCD